MLRDSIKEESYFVIYLGDNKYAKYVNDCAWHTSGLTGATKLDKEEVNKIVDELGNAGYDIVVPRAVDVMFNVYDVPCCNGDNKPPFDVIMTWHPYYIHPRMAKNIIYLKTSYCQAAKKSYKVLEDSTRHSMCHLIHEYSDKGVKFCPRCNMIEDGTMTTPETFGSVMLWTRVDNSNEGYVCEQCGYQSTQKIEHWG